MNYVSTRGQAPALSFEEAVLSGVAPDGGLYMPSEFPHFELDEIASWKDLSYTGLAEKVMWPYVEGTIPQNDFRALLEKSYSSFRDPAIAPLHKLTDSHHILELFHGPTLAFKDFALQFLGNLLDYLLDRRGEDVVIIGATSGDTGSAAIAGCEGCKHIELFMLHPLGRVSDVQRRQMTTIHANNIHNIAIEGDFDDCQNMVKYLFQHPEFIGDKRLTAVNSINWARLMAQIVYYFYAALKLDGLNRPLTFSVPTGNFGDILAGYIAHQMGLPVKRLIIATNTNDILHRFLQHNDYSKSGTVPTAAPSMDIQISSNLERLLFHIHGNDGAAINTLMQQFNKTGSLSIAPEKLATIAELFSSYKTDDAAIKQVIKAVHDEHDYILDPHTATGVNAAMHCATAGEKVVTLATAHPAKFPAVIQEAIDMSPALPEHLADLHAREEQFFTLPNSRDTLSQFICDTIA